MSLVNVMCSSTTPVINNNSPTVGATWKTLAVFATKHSTGAALSNLLLERNPMQIAKWGFFFNLGLIYVSCQANFWKCKS